MSSHTSTAAIGTEMNFDTPKISMPAAMPANSEMVLPRLVRNSAIMM